MKLGQNLLGQANQKPGYGRWVSKFIQVSLNFDLNDIKLWIEWAV